MSSNLDCANNEVNTKAASPYQVGTLRYSRFSLIIVFIWLLLGNFFFMLMTMTIPTLLPLSLKAMNASNMVIGLVVGSMPSLMNILINPIISVKSDRYRSRFGRRIPFILLGTPFLALFLILIGYSDVIGEWLASNIFSSYSFSKIGLTLTLICIFAVCFHFFNLVVSSIYQYLIPDVVPEHFMGRFYAWFRVMGMLSGFLFYRYILGFSNTHMKEIYLVIGIAYLICFLLMCRYIKEGQYQLPPERVKSKGFVDSVRRYLSECLCDPIYKWIFLGTTIFGIALIPLTTFLIFFPRDNLGMSLGEIGKINGWSTLLIGCLLVPLGSISDKFHPLRIYILGIIVFVIGMAISFFTIQDKSTYFIYSMITQALFVLYIVSCGPMFILLVPKEKYGQFGSANAIINCVGLIIGNFLAGKFFDIMGSYRYQYIWVAFFGALSLIPMYFVYREWLQRGGAKGYSPP
ncbi:MAG: hypothetical protein A2Y10_03490 [Planctomycetes bacterium GWF2_41_51]|nr:MAG: hypothetical protein A2Y10_03490 [Planctomycetes bacterium GWF2_41_51]HBG28956.1 hypothetical protein [Phycisphaerales bacterium]